MATAVLEITRQPRQHLEMNCNTYVKTLLFQTNGQTQTHSCSNNNVVVGWKLSQMFTDFTDDAPINKMLPKELLLRVFSFLDVVSLCRSAQVRH